MARTREIRHKIRTVLNVQQICRAMKTVATVRLRRVEPRVSRAQRYVQQLHEAIEALGRPDEHPLFAAGPSDRRAVVLVVGDRGLCGGYNAALLRAAQAELARGPAVLFLVGRKGQEFFRRRGVAVAEALAPIPVDLELGHLRAIAERVETLYRRGEVGSVIAVYAEFLGGILSRTLREQILPLPPPVLRGVPPLTEPGPERLLDRMLTRYLRSALYKAAVNGAASEHSARVRAMTAATDNAEEMIVGLRRQYNKARQAAITKEITEIAGSAEALR